MTKANPKRGSPSFTIIIPTLNEEGTLPNLIKDLQNQTFSDFNTIIVDGQSKDKTVEVAQNFNKKKLDLKIIISPKRNVAYQRNLGAQSSTSTYLVFMDADNRLPPYFLQGIKFHIEMLDPDILSTWFISDRKSRYDKTTAILTNVLMDMNKNAPYPFILEAMMVVKKTSFKLLNGFDPKITWHEGSDLLKRAQKLNMKYEFVREPKYVYSFRRLRKVGTFKTLTGIAQHEFTRILKGKLDKTTANRYYPMEGGGFYKVNSKTSSGIQKLIKALSKTKIF